MKTRLLIPAIGLASALAAPRAALGQEGQFIIYFTNCKLGTAEIFNAVGDGGDPESIVNFSRERACAAGEKEEYVAKVRGQKVLMMVEQGKMSVDYANPENPTFAMYNARNNTHATWTGEELKALINEMMGGAQASAGAGNAMADAMAQARAAMGAQAGGEVEGLYSVNSLTDCDDQAYGAHQGKVGFDGGNPMQQNWILRACVTNKHPDALRTFRAMQNATNQFASMGQEKKPIDEKEDELAEKGLPMTSS